MLQPLVCAPLLLAAIAPPALAGKVEDCAAVPPVTALVEPWEETSATLGAGAIRLALLGRVEGAEGVGLVVLTLPPEPPEGGDGAAPAPPGPPPERRCRIVSEGAIGFASIDLSDPKVTEDEEVATLTADLPALRFIPESTELEEVTLRLTFGVRDDSLTAETLEAP